MDNETKETITNTITGLLNLECVEEKSETWNFAETLIKIINKSFPVDKPVKPDFCVQLCKTCGYWKVKVYNDRDNYKFCNNKNSLLFNRIIYTVDTRRFSCNQWSKNSV